jgi:hypothetical protein
MQIQDSQEPTPSLLLVHLQCISVWHDVRPSRLAGPQKARWRNGLPQNMDEQCLHHGLASHSCGLLMDTAHKSYELPHSQWQSEPMCAASGVPSSDVATGVSTSLNIAMRKCWILTQPH